MIWQPDLMPRYSNRPLVESALSMSVYDLLKAAKIRPGQDGDGGLRWWRMPSREPAGSIFFHMATSDPDAAHARLIYTARGKPVDCRVELERTPCHFGGWRWWFTCPHCGARIGKLHISGPSGAFACRAAHRLAYHSERTSDLQTGHDRLRRLYVRLRLPYPPARDVLPRPKGMHRRTYHHILVEIADAEGWLNDAWYPRAMRRLARIERRLERCP